MSDDGGNAWTEERVPPPNQQHVAWLNEGVESWNRRREMEPFTPELTWIVANADVYADHFGDLWPGPPIVPQDLCGVDLSGADLRRSILARGVFRDANLKGADLTGVSAFSADFGGADFRGAQLWEFTTTFSNFRGAKFRDAVFFKQPEKGFWANNSDFSDADLSQSNLTGARFFGAEFPGANLSDSNLSGAGLVFADLARAELDRTRLWKAELFESLYPGIDFAPSKEFELNRVESLRDLAKIRPQLLDTYARDVYWGRVAFYFRGEPCTRMPLRPTVMRGGLRPFESDLLTGLKTEFPAVFAGHDTAIDELAIARHFGLPARILDVTRNPQVALYWASGECEGIPRPTSSSGSEEIDESNGFSCRHPHESCDGRIHVFALRREFVRPFDSDRVSIVANFARLSYEQQESLLTKQREDFEYKYIESDDQQMHPRLSGMEVAITTLLHNIQREKPYFTPDIDIRDLFRVFIVEPRRSFDRIRAQSGAFMLSAFHERFEGAEVAKKLGGTKLYDHHVITIPAGRKGEIRDELDWFGVNAPTLYADVESAADAVSGRFRELAERLNAPTDDSESGRATERPPLIIDPGSLWPGT